MVGTLSDILSVSLQVALVATLVVMVPGALTGYVLSRFRFPGKRLLSAVVLMPLVLPPTAVGFLLLELFADNGPLGRKSLGVDLDLLLTWKGAVVASAFMALPLVVRTARVTFDGLDPRHELVAQSLGYSRSHALWRFILPAARRGLVAAALLAFARSLGEFGATVMVAGNIPGKTQTLASAMWAADQAGEASAARVLLCVALGIGLVATLLAERFSSRN